MKLKVTLINKLYYPWIGGIESHVKNLAEGILAFATVSVICCNTKKTTKTEPINGVNVTKYASRGKLFSLPMSLPFFKNMHHHSADIIHIHLPNPLAVMAYLVAPPKGKLIVTWHSDIIKQKIILLFYAPFLNHFLKKAAKIITTSPNMILNSKFLKKHQQKTLSIPLSIDPEKYPYVALAKPLPRFALFVGRLIYYKGVLELIAAMEQTDVNVVIIGEGPLEATIRKKAANLIKKEQLIILPFQKDNELKAFFCNCDYFILPSTHASEAFGIVQLEAMIYKKALISTNLPTGVPFVNKHQQTGLVVEPGNASELATAMQTLWTNEALNKTYGQNAYTRCLTYFTEEKMIENTKQAYHSVLHNSQPISNS